MEIIELTEFIKYGTPGILLVLIVLNVVQMLMIHNQSKDIDGIKNGITWKDTCEERHENIDRRLERIEAIQNGG